MAAQRAGDAMRTGDERAPLHAAGITPRIVGTIADNATLLGLVAASQSVTVVPARVLDDTQHDVTIASENLGITRTIHAVTRKTTTATVSRLLDLLEQPPESPTVAHSS